MSDDVYFKNPYRGRKVIANKPYVPEHERLDVEAVEYPVKDPEDLIRMNKKAEAEKKIKEKRNKAKSLIEQLRSGEITEKQFQEAVDRLEEKTFGKSGIVSSGQNEDNLWTQALEQPEVENSSPGTVLYPEVYNDDIKADEILPKQEEIIDDLPEETSFGFEQVNPGQFILIYKDNVVNVGTIDQVKETLSNVLIEGEAKLEEFIILKRVSAEMGIFIGS